MPWVRGRTLLRRDFVSEVGRGWRGGPACNHFGIADSQRVRRHQEAVYKETILRPGIIWKWRTLRVAISNPSSRAVTPIARSSKARAIPFAALAFNASDTSGDLQCQCMDWDIAAHLFDEGQPLLAPGIGLGAIGSMHQLGDGNDGEPNIDLPVSGAYLFKDVSDVVAAAFGGNHDAGVENQSHAGGFQGWRLRMISSTSAAKSGSRTGDSPVSSSCLLASAMHSEMVRRPGTGGWITATGSLPPSSQ
jgi:hypothetical protein